MTIARKIDGEWQAVSGVVELTRTVATRTVFYQYADGRQEGGGEEPCAPYEVADMLDIGKVEQMVRDGVWGADDLAPYGLAVVEPFTAPEGKQATGERRIVEVKGVVREDYDVEDIPPPPPPETVGQKKARLLADYGLTPEDFAPKAEKEADAAIR